jgi:hypothetical protein
MQNAKFGILTLATPGDWLKAIGLALSVRVSNPGIPIAVACSPKLRGKLSPFFDYVIDENPDLRGFIHKVHLDRYSPFETTLFFDSDVLVFRPVLPFIEEWGDQPYTACGNYRAGGRSSFGLQRSQVLPRLGKAEMVHIDGAGHALFKKPGCEAVFDRAREVSAEYSKWAGDAVYADEDAMNIVMTMMDLKPVPHGEFFSRYIGATPGTMEMDATKGICRFVFKDTGKPVEPCMMHFAANEAALPYTWQLWRLFRKFGAPTKGLLSLGLADFADREVKLRLHQWLSRLRARRMSLSPTSGR